MKKTKKILIIIIALLFFCWGAMLAVDFSLSKQTKAPIFAIRTETTDQDRYIGLGYTVVLRYNGAIGMSEEQLKGYFYLGWR